MIGKGRTDEEDMEQLLKGYRIQCMTRKIFIPSLGHLAFWKGTADNVDVLIIPAMLSCLFFLLLDSTKIDFSLSISGQVNEDRGIEMGLNYP